MFLHILSFMAQKKDPWDGWVSLTRLTSEVQYYFLFNCSYIIAQFIQKVNNFSYIKEVYLGFYKIKIEDIFG